MTSHPEDTLRQLRCHTQGSSDTVDVQGQEHPRSARWKASGLHNPSLRKQHRLFYLPITAGLPLAIGQV